MRILIIFLPPERKHFCFILETYLGFPLFMVSCIPFFKSNEMMILQMQKNQEVEGQEDPKKGLLETWHLSLRLLVSKS